jgi:hypothetical protein
VPVSFTDQIQNSIKEPASIKGLVNGQYPESALRPIRSSTGAVIGSLCAEAARAWTAMVAAAKAGGVSLGATVATNTYRPLADQQRIFTDRYRETDQGNGHRQCGSPPKTWFLRQGKKTAACPGTSNHGRGLAVDVRGADEPGPVLEWLEEHAATYGWQWETASESWHIHYCPGDAIPAAVLAHEADHPEEDEVTDKDKKDIVDAVNAHVDARVNKAIDDLVKNLATRLDRIETALGHKG